MAINNAQESIDPHQDPDRVHDKLTPQSIPDKEEEKHKEKNVAYDRIFRQILKKDFTQARITFFENSLLLPKPLMKQLVEFFYIVLSSHKKSLLKTWQTNGARQSDPILTKEIPSLDKQYSAFVQIAESVLQENFKPDEEKEWKP